MGHLDELSIDLQESPVVSIIGVLSKLNDKRSFPLCDSLRES